MPREVLAALHQALRFGPGHCPPGLFAGGVPSIVRALKVHSNNISHARHVALEETYPRLLRLIGPEAFHRQAEPFLDQDDVSSRRLDAIGEGFERQFKEPAHRDLARTEWAWLQAFHAAEADTLMLAELAAMRPKDLLSVRFGVHPAAHWFALEELTSFRWDYAIADEGDILLITRPKVEVLLRRIDHKPARVLSLLSDSRVAGELPGLDLPALITLIDAGAVVLETRP